MKASNESFSSRYLAVASLTAGGVFRPIFRYSASPSRAQLRIPGSSASSFTSRFLSCSASGMVTLKGMSCTRRHAAWFLSDMAGLLFAANQILPTGWKVKCSLKRNLAVIGSPPVQALITCMDNLEPSSASIAVITLAPARAARSFRTFSFL